MGGRYSRDYFNRFGDLRHIRRLRVWPLEKVLLEKYEFQEQDAREMADFLIQILDYVPEKRLTAAQCLNHPWISGVHIQATPSTTQPKEVENGHSDKERDKDEREAMEVRVGNMAIDGASRPSKEAISLSSP